MPSGNLGPWDSENEPHPVESPYQDHTWTNLSGDNLSWVIPVTSDSDLPLALPADDDIPSVVAIAKPPQPGFWLSSLLCVVYLIVTQLIPGIAVVVVFLVMQMVSAGSFQAGITEMMGQDKGQAFSRRILMPSLLVAQVAGVLFSLFMIRAFMGKDWTRKIALRKPGMVHLVLVLIGFPALPILASGVFELAKHFLPSFGELFRVVMPGFISVLRFFSFTLDEDIMGMEALVKEIRTWPWQLAVLIIGVGPGLNEELWCRGFLGRGLVARYGYVVGILMTSVFFGVLHIDPQQGFMAACMGLALHFTYVMTRSLWIPMLLHFMNNSLSAVASHLGAEVEKIDTAGETIPVFLYIASSLLMAAVGYALYVSRARLVPAVDSEHNAWQPDYPSVECPPDGSGTIVRRPWPTLLASGLVAIAFLIFLTTAYVAFSQP
jgi:membrane protease YdiL (CAAX protease family)